MHPLGRGRTSVPSRSGSLDACGPPELAPDVRANETFGGLYDIERTSLYFADRSNETIAGQPRADKAAAHEECPRLETCEPQPSRLGRCSTSENEQQPPNMTCGPRWSDSFLFTMSVNTRPQKASRTDERGTVFSRRTRLGVSLCCDQ